MSGPACLPDLGDHGPGVGGGVRREDRERARERVSAILSPRPAQQDARHGGARHGGNREQAG